MAQKYLICLCILMMGVGALGGCQDSMVTNDVVRDYGLFIRFQEASAKDFQNTYSEENLNYMLLHDKVARYGFDRIRCYLDNDAAAMLDDFRRYGAVYHQIGVLGLGDTVQQMLEGAYPYAKAELLEYTDSYTYKEFMELAEEKGVGTDEVLDTVYYNCVEIMCMDEVLAAYFGRVHKSLANPYPRTPAMAAGVADHVWTLQEIAGLLDSN